MLGVVLASRIPLHQNLEKGKRRRRHQSRHDRHLIVITLSSPHSHGLHDLPNGGTKQQQQRREQRGRGERLWRLCSCVVRRKNRKRRKRRRAETAPAGSLLFCVFLAPVGENHLQAKLS
jgi:hypothetical protein